MLNKTFTISILPLKDYYFNFDFNFHLKEKKYEAIPNLTLLST